MEHIEISDLKKLTKFVLKEIAPVPERPDNPFQAVIRQLSQDQEENPLVIDIDVARQSVHADIDDLFKATEDVIRVSLSKKDDYDKCARDFNQSRESALYVIRIWARKIIETKPEMKSDIVRVVNIIHSRIFEIGSQLGSIGNDLNIYGNNINAIKKVRYLREMFTTVKKDVDVLFKLAKKAGFGKPKK